MQGKFRRLASDHIGFRDILQRRRQRRKAALLFQSAANPADFPECFQGLEGRIHIGGLAVIDEFHPVLLGNQLAAVRQPRKAVKCPLDHLGRQPQRAAGGIGCAGVLVVVLTGQALDISQIYRAGLTALAVFRKEPLAREYRPSRPRQLAVDRHPDHPVIPRRLGHLPGQEQPLGLVHPDHRPVRPALGEQPPLGREIATQPCVTIQMIGR